MIVEKWTPTMNVLRPLSENRAKVIDLLHRAEDLEAELQSNFPKPGDIFGIPVLYVLKLWPASSGRIFDGYGVQQRQNLSTKEILRLLDEIEQSACASTVFIICIRSNSNEEEIETTPLSNALYKEFYRLDEQLESTDFISRNLKLKNQDLDENGKAVLEKMLAGPLQVNDRSLVKGKYGLHRLTDIHADVHTVALEANHLLTDLSKKFNFWRDKRNPIPKYLPPSVGTELLRIDGVFRYSIAFEKLIVYYEDRERTDEIMTKVEAFLRDQGYYIPVILDYRKGRRRNIRQMNNHLEIRHGDRHGTLGIVATAKKSDTHTYRVGFTAAHIIDPTSQDSVFLKDLEIGPCVWPKEFDKLLYDMAVIKIEKNIDQLNFNFPTIEGHLNHVRMFCKDR